MVALVSEHPNNPPVLLTSLSRKQEAVAGVIDGRVSLREAAARFRAAGGARPDADEETVCRSVIGWVHLALCDRPERAERVTARLEYELQTALGGSGRLS